MADSIHNTGQLLKILAEQQGQLDREQARSLLESILRGEASEVEIAAVFGALAARGETAAEIAGFADAMRAAVVTLPLNDSERASLVDTCGTGGDASGTFNISTAAALVAAAAGATVAKHGNRAVTSRCGSADVLEALGIPVDLPPEAASEALRKHRFAFLLAPSHHPAMKAVMPVRKALPFRTVFNVLGPLTNPAGAQAQVMGVYSARLVPLVAEAMAMLGVRHALVVHGDDSLDELSLSGPSQVAEVRGNVVGLKTIRPEDVDLDPAPRSALQGGDAMANAQILMSIFLGERGPKRDVVVLNAAAVLLTSGLAPDLRAGAELAGQAIDQGKVTALVNALGGK
jgi:anthranilate phosphoribosyltransferase